ncbi:MAG TPA: glycoside hydrolase family 5 protein [Bacillota bacterium]|nr:glycoside hydrolase family 5 protein [Bacillota bacterium]
MQQKPLKGVNLGGWLVLEKWITPSLFADTTAVDEYTFCKQASKRELTRLQHFRDSFITKQDFVWLAAQGIQAVRLPIGYWVFGDAAPYQPTSDYVNSAFAWANETGIKILLDLHGVPGSQNGKDHSGQKGTVAWSQNTDDVSRTLRVVRRLAERYGRNQALLGISLLNEPARLLPKATLRTYYETAYDILREHCRKDAWIVFSDGFAPRRWRTELSRKTHTHTYIDTHHYQVFSPLDKRLSVRLNLLRTHWQLPRKLARMNRHHPVVVGEWSLTLGGSNLAKYSGDKRRALLKEYARLQLKAYQRSAAWFFWTYRTEHGGSWSFRDCVMQGLLD